jgi:uncharacterized protein YndB with AHSA1/START domain
MSELSLTVSKVIKAPIEKVFRAWVEPEQMKQWYSPEGMTTPDASSDACKGGEYSVTMKMGDETFTMGGEYLEFDEPNGSTGSPQAKLVFSWSPKDGHDGSGKHTVVTVIFKAIDDNQTEVNLTHQGFLEEPAKVQHQEGWVGTLNKLVKFTN